MRKSTPDLVSKALADKQISDAEFTIITREVEKYHQLKKEIREGVKKATKEAVTQTPDLDKLTQERIHKEVEQEIQKKLNRLVAPSKSDLKD